MGCKLSGLGLSSLAMCLLGTACYAESVIKPDTLHFSSEDNGLAAITLNNEGRDALDFNIPTTGTVQYSVVANPSSNAFYASLVHGVSYCTLTASEGGGYIASVAAGQSCDILLRAATNNPPSTVQFTLNISAEGANDPITVNLNNYLYVGGEFTADNTGGKIYNHLAKWNGSRWSAVSSTGVDDNVNVIAVDPISGDLYAGGWFNSAGNVVVNGIAKFNRKGANALGAGFNNAVNTLAFNPDNDAVVAGGNFTASGSSALNYLAVFTGSLWTNLDPSDTLTGPVKALTYDASNNLWIGGDFPQVDNRNTFGNKVVYPLYEYTSSGLSPVIYANDRVDSLLSTTTNGLLVGGDFSQYVTTLGGAVTNIGHIGSLIGTTLTQIGQNRDIIRGVKSLVQVGNTLYLSGYFETAYPGMSPNPNPYGTMQIVASCNLQNNICININTPNYNRRNGTYWVYRLVADNTGTLYGVTKDNAALDNGSGVNLVYTYTTTEGWQVLSTIGFNYLAFTEALGSVINISN